MAASASAVHQVHAEVSQYQTGECREGLASGAQRVQPCGGAAQGRKEVFNGQRLYNC